MEKDKFKKLFPNLSKELDSDDSTVKIDKGMPQQERKWAGYNPDAVDFIRRCTTEDEALEIIEYLESKGEISSENAIEYRLQLKRQGLKSFGSHKEADFYHKNR